MHNARRSADAVNPFTDTASRLTVPAARHGRRRGSETRFQRIAPRGPPPLRSPAPALPSRGGSFRAFGRPRRGCPGSGAVAIANDAIVREDAEARLATLHAEPRELGAALEDDHAE